jgi:hypothetical protein
VQPWIAQNLLLDATEAASIQGALSASLSAGGSGALPPVLLDDAWSADARQLAAGLRALGGGLTATWSIS